MLSEVSATMTEEEKSAEAEISSTLEFFSDWESGVGNW